jgi:hypothetical protein
LEYTQNGTPSFVPKIGFFIANDLPFLLLVFLGEGMVNRYEYWEVSKSFPNFLPVSEKICVPKNLVEKDISCVSLIAIIKGEEKQNEKSIGVIFTPKLMLDSILQNYPNDSVKKGDRVIMGTLGEVETIILK